MQVEDAKAACNDDILSSTFRQTTATLLKHTLEDITVSCSVVSRRLSSNSRRLAGSVEFTYRVAMPSEEAAISLVTAFSAVPAETLTQLISDALPADHGPIIVTGKSEPTIVVPLTNTTTTPGAGEELPDSHACTPAAFASLAVALIAVVISG